MKIKSIINGKEVEMEVSPTEKLVDVLRRYGYKSVKKGCDNGDCGSCSILMDGELVTSCTILAPRAHNKTIMTVEGLGTKTKPHAIQEAYVESATVQCGYCIPGSILATKALLDENPDPTEGEIKEALDGNLCRCTGYVKRITAVQDAAKRMREES